MKDRPSILALNLVVLLPIAASIEAFSDSSALGGGCLQSTSSSLNRISVSADSMLSPIVAFAYHFLEDFS